MQETHIHSFKSPTSVEQPAVWDPIKVLKIAGGLCGAALMITSLIFVFRLFTFFHGQLTDPQAFTVYIQQLTDAVGGDDLTLVFGENEVRAANYLAIITFGFGILIMGWLAAKMLITGGTMIEICLRDKKPVPQKSPSQAQPAKLNHTGNVRL